MTGFVETHRYLRLHTADGRRLRVSCAYVRQLEEAPGGGTLITVADQASTRHVVESIDDITARLEEGTVRYTEK
jgi:hypothetical protein